MMYYARCHAAEAWAGEPENDPTIEDDQPVGPTLTPKECMQKAHESVIKEPGVIGGEPTNRSSV